MPARDDARSLVAALDADLGRFPQLANWAPRGRNPHHNAKVPAGISVALTNASDLPTANSSERQLAYYAKVKKGIDLLTVEQALTHGGNFGSEQQVIDTLHVLQEELGVTHYICWFRIPTLDRTRALKSMENFATRVIPHLRDPAPKRVAAALN